jgi:hypothetical protein
MHDKDDDQKVKVKIHLLCCRNCSKFLGFWDSIAYCIKLSSSKLSCAYNLHLQSPFHPCLSQLNLFGSENQPPTIKPSTIYNMKMNWKTYNI